MFPGRYALASLKELRLLQAPQQSGQVPGFYARAALKVGYAVGRELLLLVFPGIPPGPR
jgi:hypothetical protein